MELQLPISSVRVQDEIKVDSFLLQHNARGFWSEAFHGCHNFIFLTRHNNSMVIPKSPACSYLGINALYHH